jgi:hypothetical protein
MSRILYALFFSHSHAVFAFTSSFWLIIQLTFWLHHQSADHRRSPRSIFSKRQNNWHLRAKWMFFWSTFWHTWLTAWSTAWSEKKEQIWLTFWSTFWSTFWLTFEMSFEMKRKSRRWSTTRCLRKIWQWAWFSSWKILLRLQMNQYCYCRFTSSTRMALFSFY